MKVFFVEDRERWGYAHAIVRAPDRRTALALVIGEPYLVRLEAGLPGREKFDVDKLERTQFEIIELEVSGDEPKILWKHDESPDTGE